MTTTKKITEAQVRKAFEAADRADMAVERHQMKVGYGRSNDRTRELRNKAQALRSTAYSLKFQFDKEQA